MQDGEHAAGAGSAAGEFEFDADEDHHFAQLSAAMTFVGVGSVVVGLLLGGLYVYFGIQLGREAAVLLATVGAVVGGGIVALGLLNAGAARSVRAIHATQGHDVAHLMRALAKLRTLFWIVAALAILEALALAGGTLGAAFLGARSTPGVAP